MTLLVTTFRTLGAHTFTTYRYRLPAQASGPLTDHTPLASSRRHGHLPAAQFEGNRLGGGRPDGERRTAVAEPRAEFAGLGRGGAVEIVEDALRLDAGGGEQPAVGVLADRDDLAGEGTAYRSRSRGSTVKAA
ncbi:hypothetical protein SALBM135S_02731 [Streptomyces alboniger]